MYGLLRSVKEVFFYNGCPCVSFQDSCSADFGRPRNNLSTSVLQKAVFYAAKDGISAGLRMA